MSSLLGLAPMAVRIAISFFRPADYQQEHRNVGTHYEKQQSDCARDSREYAAHISYCLFPERDQSTPEPAFEDGYLAANPRVIVSISAFACPRLTSSANVQQPHRCVPAHHPAPVHWPAVGLREDPMFWIHTKAEGSLDYTTLFYVPSKAPLDLYQAEYKTGVKLYVKRVFITDDSKDLLPQYLRFVRAIIDSEDLPLNVSREILQQNRVLTNIRTASVKQILSEFKNIAANQPELYLKFISEYTARSRKGFTAITQIVRHCSTWFASNQPRWRGSPTLPM
jgi:Hsp90 protein